MQCNFGIGLQKCICIFVLILDNTQLYISKWPLFRYITLYQIKHLQSDFILYVINIYEKPNHSFTCIRMGLFDIEFIFYKLHANTICHICVCPFMKLIVMMWHLCIIWQQPHFCIMLGCHFLCWLICIMNIL